MNRLAHSVLTFTITRSGDRKDNLEHFYLFTIGTTHNPFDQYTRILVQVVVITAITVSLSLYMTASDPSLLHTDGCLLPWVNPAAETAVYDVWLHLIVQSKVSLLLPIMVAIIYIIF